MNKPTSYRAPRVNPERPRAGDILVTWAVGPRGVYHNVKGEVLNVTAAVSGPSYWVFVQPTERGEAVGAPISVRYFPAFAKVTEVAA